MKFLLMLVVLFASACSSEEKGVNAEKVSSKKFKVEEVYSGDGVLWSFSFLNNDQVFIAHRSGKLFLYNLKTKKKTQLRAPDVWTNGQGGLLDVLYHKGDLYLTYSKPNPEGKAFTALAKGSWKEGKLQNLRDIFVSNADGDGGIHFGSRLALRGEELFMTIGERGERDKAQSLDYHNGKVLRLTLDGRPYPGNPYVDKDGLDEIYSYGHRNPQGISIHENKIYVAEMGPRGETKSTSLGLEETMDGLSSPMAQNTMVPRLVKKKKREWSSLSLIGSQAFPLQASLFRKGKDLYLACLSGTQVRMVEIDDGKAGAQKELLYDMEERFRSAEDGPDGLLYLSTDSGKIYRVSKQ